jgi:hypothetical protein
MPGPRKVTAAPLADAHRVYEAGLRSGWERDYQEAIKEARAGKASRLADLLRAHRPLTGEDYDLLADHIERVARRPGRERNEAEREAARLAKTLLELLDVRGRSKRDAVVLQACLSVKKTAGRQVDVEAVHDLLRHGPSRYL